MTASPIFDWLSDALERRTGFTRLEARGTVRLVLKHAGIEPAAVTPRQAEVVLARLMPPALKKRRVAEAEAVCAELVDDLRAFSAQVEIPDVETAYDVFARLDATTREKKR